MDSVKELVQRAVCEQGRPEGVSFGHLVQKYQDYVFSYLLSLGMDHASASDVAQETFMEAYIHLGSLKNPGAFAAWLRSIAYRKFLRNRQSPVSDEFLEDFHSGSIYSAGNETGMPGRIGHPAAGSPEQQLEQKEIDRELRTALGSLKEENRTILLLYHLNGFAQKDIAEFLDLSVDVVKKRLERTRNKLKKEMMHMVKEQIQDILPSRDSSFFENINLAVSFDKAARIGELCLVEAMLIDGIDVNARDIKGRTLLHIAAENGNYECARLLIKWHARADLKNKRGQIPSECAKQNGYMEMAAYLETCCGK